ncbi:MAG: UvrD-helicase domain-containing protein [Kofleriaceae bacterium]|nr:UvrD-helicase domain-containing protein [Kofleriaceae bacterium]
MRGLNPEQYAAATHVDGPLLVLAGAGTGKTRVLVHRIAHLVECRAEPWTILAVTFTKKAADEMRHRLRGLLGSAADAMWIGTFHATCARLLRRWPERVGLTKHFAIFDDDDQMKLIGRLVKEAKIEEYVTPRTILTRIDRAKNRGVDPATELTGVFTDEYVALIFPKYQAQLEKENAVDFNDILLKTIKLADDELVGTRIRTMFRHVLVDEFQDTNSVQYDLVRRFADATRNLTVVGDDDQAIYGWRGANPRNLLDFDRDHPDAKVVKLEQNYRSTQVVLDAANAVISRNQDRRGKSLWTESKGGDLIEQFVAGDERGEAYFIASGIRRMLDEGPYSPSDFAVLYRTNAQSRVLEEHMRACRVPAKVIGAVSFFERKEVKDTIGYLRLLANPAADSAFDRIVNVPARGIGEATVERLRAAARADGSSTMAAARAAVRGEVSGLGAGPRKKLAVFVDVMDGLASVMAAGASVAEIIIQVVERSGLRAKLEAEDTEEARDRLSNLAELVTTASDFDDERANGSGAAMFGEFAKDDAEPLTVAAAAPHASEKIDAGGTATDGAPLDSDAAALDADALDSAPAMVAPPATIDEFLERIALASVSDQAAGTDYVTLMTVHIAKGLEYPVVYVAGMEDGLFPSLREREDQSADVQLEEERRLAYVAFTRAKHRLTLTWARTRRVWGDIRFQTPSRFLDDVPPHCVAGSNSRAMPTAGTGMGGGGRMQRPVLQDAWHDFDGGYDGGYDSRPSSRGDGGGNGRFGGPPHVAAVRAVVAAPVVARNPVHVRTPTRDEFDQRSFDDDEPVFDVNSSAGRRHSSTGGPNGLATGTKVSHAAFGVGRVITASGDGVDRKAVVDFPSVGTKTVLARFLQVQS